MRRVFSTSSAGALVLVVFFVAFFGITADGFTSSFNLFNLSRNIGINAIIGFSMMTVLVLGGINLSLGAIAVAAVMMFGWMVETALLAWPLACVLALVFGTALGTLNGVLVVVTRLHSFVVTLATASIYYGAMIYLSQAMAYRQMPQVFSDFSRIRIFDRFSIYLVIALGVALVLAVMYRSTLIGRQMLAAGANPVSARISGVPVSAAVITSHALSGLIATGAAFLLLARTGAAIPSMTGDLGIDWLLPAMIGPVLGGVALAGGTVSVGGAFLGAAFFTILSNGLQLTEVADFWVQSCLGLTLIGALFLDKLRSTLTGEPA